MQQLVYIILVFGLLLAGAAVIGLIAGLLGVWLDKARDKEIARLEARKRRTEPEQPSFEEVIRHHRDLSTR